MISTVWDLHPEDAFTVMLLVDHDDTPPLVSQMFTSFVEDRRVIPDGAWFRFVAVR